MKKIVVTVLVGGLALMPFGDTAASAQEVEQVYTNEEGTVEDIIVSMDDYTLESVEFEDGDIFSETQTLPIRQSREATGHTYKTVSSSYVKGSKQYLGTVTKTRNYTFNFKVSYMGASISLGTSKSVSGKFKKYKQNVTVTVKCKKYVNGSGQYLGTYTYKSNGLTYTYYEPI